MEQAPPPDSLQPAAHSNDAFFKAIYSDPEHATAFFKRHLSPPITAAIDWSTLVVLPASFVQSTLRQTHSDLLFSVRAGERETLLHLLFEHQTTPDPVMPLRLLGYTLEILNRHHTAHGLPLPPVISFVLHQGPDAWKVSTAFEDLFELPQEITADLLPFLPRFRHALLDLSRYDPAAGEDDYRQQAILQLMKLARERKLLAYFHWLAESLTGQLTDHLLFRLLGYALHSDSDLDAERIYRSLSSNPELEQQAMSVAEKLRAEGRLEGRAEGHQEGLGMGIEKGLVWGKIQNLQQLLQKPQSPVKDLKALAPRDLETLHQSLLDEFERRFKRP